MAWTDAHRLTYDEFRQKVRQYRPSDLLPTLARYSAALDMQSPVNRIRSDGTDVPWLVSAVARESLVWGNEYRNKTAGPLELQTLLQACHDVDDFADDVSLSEILTPLLHEQFLYGQAPYSEACRVYALMDAPDLGARFDWRSILGLDLEDAVRASFILRTWVTHNEGRFDPGLLERDHIAEAFKRIAPRTHVEALARALTTTPLRGTSRRKARSPA